MWAQHHANISDMIGFVFGFENYGFNRKMTARLESNLKEATGCRNLKHQNIS
jgi:hypothetical protein